MIKLSLYDMAGVGVVVAVPTGVLYSNQTGGTACLQPEMEGAFLPLNSDHPEGDPAGLEAMLIAAFEGAGHFNKVVADRVDQALARFMQTDGFHVDRRRMPDSHEAWVHVTMRHVESSGLQNTVGSMTGVLTWPNSD